MPWHAVISPPGTACKPRRGLTQTSLGWDVKFIRKLRLYIRNLRIYIRSFRIYIRNLRFYFMHRPGEVYPPGSAGLCTGQRPLPPESGVCGWGITAPAMHSCGRGVCERCVIVPPHQTFLLVVAVTVLWMIVAMTGRAAAVCPGAVGEGLYLALPSQVQRCQTYSSGPCLCLPSHHLQKVSWSAKVHSPISRLTV